ncbi:thiosulfate:glutathione sulfurtransferase [Pteropus vampyrus]|uniref:Thiosulfate:glutathione sulfurtransferase n=1 Tax=Pteropus vampyrus TaxID=132908 RepID=A0A6P6BQ91_PTEVA|nr:thiosulfate:glutathione sulfurtransferase [Pteropus vampyrus]
MRARWARPGLAAFLRLVVVVSAMAAGRGRGEGDEERLRCTRFPRGEPRQAGPSRHTCPSAAPTVSLPELRSLLAAGRAPLIDVRSREEAAEGTIAGALSIPMSERESAPQMEPAAFRAAYAAEKRKVEDENLIFFCQMSKRGPQATQLARSLGYRGYGAGAPPAGEQLGTARPAEPCPALPSCLSRGARNYAGAYKEWFQKWGFHPPEPT